jgi:phenylacetate-CoA ligase
MSVSGRILLNLTHFLRRSRTLAILPSIQSEPYSSRSELLQLQIQKLSRLLNVAQTHVPYYREMFRSLGIQARDIRTLQDFSALPVLTKSLVRERLQDLIHEGVPKERLITEHSGGSTGVPLKFYRTREENDVNEACFFRTCMQSGWKPGDMVAFFWGDRDRASMSNWEWELRQHLRRLYQFDAFESGPDQMEHWVKKWNRIKPVIVIGYSSALHRFALHVERTGQKLRPVRGVFSTAEKLYPTQKHMISRIFGCHVYDMYGSSEVHNIACTCPRDRMHVNIDNVVLETDHSGLLPGQPSALIVTSLRSETMPFIRYRNEDCGELMDGMCECGNHFPLMKLDISRIFDHFVLPGSRVVHGMLFVRLMDIAKGISTFQFHQTAPDAITLWIVPDAGENELREASIQKIVAQLKSLDPNGRIQVQVRMTDSIPLSRNGKHCYIRSDVRPDASIVNSTHQSTA